MKQPSILVTGGAGFIGSALVYYLNQNNIENILITDILNNDNKWKNLVPLKFLDYCQADTLLDFIRNNDHLLDSIHTIFHLGAYSSTTESNLNNLIKNNFEYSKILAHWAIHHNIRFIYASSAATYGQAHDMSDDINSLEKLRPINPYGYSKHLFDLYALKQGWLEKIVGIKYFNVFGPNEGHKLEMKSLVAKAYKQIVSEGKVTLFRSHIPSINDGEQKRDFIYIKDAVAMTMHLSHSKASGIFNVGTSIPRTWNDLAKGLFQTLKREECVEYIDIPVNIRSQYQYYTSANISRLLETGWNQPLFSLEAAIDDYVQNYLITNNYLGF